MVGDYFMLQCKTIFVPILCALCVLNGLFESLLLVEVDSR